MKIGNILVLTLATLGLVACNGRGTMPSGDTPRNELAVSTKVPVTVRYYVDTRTQVCFAKLTEHHAGGEATTVVNVPCSNAVFRVADKVL